MSSSKALLDSILSNVKRHSFLTDDELLERRQLSTAILDNFKSWISSVVIQEQQEENNNNNNSIKNDIETVGSACLQIAQMRLSTAQKKTSDDDDQEAQSFYANDATLRLVIDCVELFVTTSSSILKNYDFSSSSSSSWKQLLIFLCTRESPLEISLRGFELLVKFVLTKVNLNNKESSSTSAVSSSNDDSIASLMRSCIGSTRNDDDDSEEEALELGTLSVRLASTLHEKFSTSSNRKFCIASNFHTILQEEIFLPNYYFSQKDVDENEDDNKKTPVVARSPLFLDAKTGKRDYLSLAVVFTSIAQVIRACGPQHLHPRVAEVFASYLTTAAAHQHQQPSSLSFNIDFMEGEVLRPFVYQSIEEMFQRGTQHDEEIQTTQTTHGDGTEEDGKSTRMMIKTSPWSDYLVVVSSDDENNYESVKIIAKSLISVMASITRNQLSSDEIELWVRAVSGFSSSALGMQKMIDNLSSSSSSDENKTNANQSSSSGFVKFLRIFASIVSQMIRTASSTGTIAAKVIGLNAIQSTAVPLSHDLTRLVKKIYSDFKNDNLVHEKDITNFKLIVLQSATFLKSLLHFTSDENNNQQQQQPSASQHFASSLFPLHRSASSSNNIGYSDDKVSDAFWSMIEQVVVAPPFVDVQKLSQLMMSDVDVDDEQNNSSSSSSSSLLLRNEVINFFIQNFAEPILSPMTPSLISLLSTTSQKELGLDLYQRRKSLAMALLRVEQLITTTQNAFSSATTNRALICGCSKIMWTKLRNSVLIAGGGQT